MQVVLLDATVANMMVVYNSSESDFEDFEPAFRDLEEGSTFVVVWCVPPGALYQQ